MRYWHFNRALNEEIQFTASQIEESRSFLKKESEENGHILEYTSSEICILMGQFYGKKVSDREVYFLVTDYFEQMQKIGLAKFKNYQLDQIIQQMGKIMYDFGNNDKALDILLKGEHLLTSNSIISTLCFNLIQNIYYQKKDYPKAIEYAQKIRNNNLTYQSDDDAWRSRFWQGLATLDIASIQIETNQIEDAEKSSESAYQLCKSIVRAFFSAI